MNTPAATRTAGPGDPNATASAPADPASAAGPPAIPGFEILGELGRGSFGVVYKATQLDLNRVVAVKTISDPLAASPARLVRFRQEADTVARLAHPNVVQIFDVGAHAGALYLVLEYVDGGTLAAAVAGVPQPPRDAAAMVETLARAVHHAHEHKIVHRDLKPANVLRTAAGVLKITDFGIARRLDAGAGLTMTADILGTPSYMAPEQADGRATAVGPAADVHALGVILYELLTGKLPFTGDSVPRVIQAVIETDPVSPRRLRPDVPRDLETVCLTCLRKEPGKRYATAAALADDLRRFQAGEPVTARRVGNAERAWRWAKRYPAVASLLAVVGLLLTVIAVGGVVLAGRFKGERDDAVAAAAERELVATKREGNLRLWTSLVSQADASRRTRQPGQRFVTLDLLREAAALAKGLELPPAEFARMRSVAVAALTLPDVHVTHTFGRWEADTNRVDLSADFELYAQTTKTGGCVVRRVADDAEVFRVPGLTGPVYPQFGPGRWLAVLEEQTSTGQVWDLSGPEPVRRLGPTAGVNGWSFRPDGSMVVEMNAGGAVTAYDLPSGTVRHRLPGVVGWDVGWGAVLHPTAPVVAQCSYFSRGGVVLRDLRTGAVQTLVPPWAGGTGGVEWSPDGRTLTATHGDGVSMVLYDFDPTTLRAATSRAMISTSFSGGSVLAFNSAGDRLALRGWSGHLALMDVGTGRTLFTHPSLPTTLTSHRFDPAGRRLAAAKVGDLEPRIGLWSVADGRECRFIPCSVHLSVSEGCYPVVSPDGRLVALRTDDGLIVLDLRAGREVAAVKFPGSRGSGHPVFDPAGRLITNGMSGCFRWPLTRDPADPTRYTLGPPERLPFFPGDHWFAVGRGGDVMAQAMYNGYGMSPYAGGWIRHPDHPTTRQVDNGTSMGAAAVSPDGNWVAFGVHLTHTRVYDARTGERVWTSPDGGNVCQFSPDGKWLATDVDGNRCYAVGTWEPGPRLGPGRITAFTPDGTTALMVTTGGVLRLVEVDTGRELTRLEDPDLAYVWAAFTPDGGRLVTGAKDGIRVWDLRLIRAQLADLGLDWDAPPLPPAEPIPPTIHPVKVEVLGKELLDPNARQRFAALRAATEPVLAVFAASRKGATAADFLRRGLTFTRLGWYDLALRDYDEAVRLDPKLAAARAARGNERSRRGRWADAVEDYAAGPKTAPVRFRRAWALVELGRHPEAVAAFTELLDADWVSAADKASFLILRAAVHEKVGDAGRAKADRDKVAAAKNLPMQLNNFAWELVTNPPESRVVGAAVVLARKAVELAPEPHLNTLGLALYRAKNFPEARQALDKSLELNGGRDAAWDDYILAMCHAKLKDPATAKTHFDRAAAWAAANAKLTPREKDELAAFRTEARRVLAGGE